MLQINVYFQIMIHCGFRKIFFNFFLVLPEICLIGFDVWIQFYKSINRRKQTKTSHNLLCYLLMTHPAKPHATSVHIQRIPCFHFYVLAFFLCHPVPPTFLLFLLFLPHVSLCFFVALSKLKLKMCFSTQNNGLQLLYTFLMLFNINAKTFSG